jgi:hypothetical protein
MVHIVPIHEFYPKIVYHKSESDGLGFVAP